MRNDKMGMDAPMAAAPMASGPMDAGGGEFAMADNLAREIMLARGADPAMIDALPPLNAEMVSADLMMMLEDYGMAPEMDEEAMFAEAAAEDEMRGGMMA
jgi:hypothetical protein